MGMGGQVIRAVAPAALDAIAQGVGNLFTAGGASGNSNSNDGSQYYNTQQADQALRSNDAYTAGKSREQLAYENQLQRQNDDAAQQRQFGTMAFSGNQGNAIANANTARNMAANAQSALNNQYMNAGNRLNDAARNTQQSLNTAAQTVASMFR